MPKIKRVLICIITCFLPLVCEATYKSSDLRQINKNFAQLPDKFLKQQVDESHVKENIFDYSRVDITKMHEHEVRMFANKTIATDKSFMESLHDKAEKIIDAEDKKAESVFDKEGDDTLLKDVSVCSSIDCRVPEFVASDDFNALMALQTVSEGNLSSGISKRNIFSGKYLTCRAMGYGYSNCCKDKGWGQDIGIAGCSRNEKKLGVAKEEGRVVRLGSKCTKKDVFGKCLKKKKAYCVFKTKLAYLVQTQARPKYINRNFGSYKYPDCDGFTLAEFQQLPIDQFKLEKVFGESRLFKDDFANSNKKRIDSKAKLRLERGNNY